MPTLKTATILGAGAMGSQLGLLCAESGLDVKLWDISNEALDKGNELINTHLDRRVKKGRLTAEKKDDFLSRIEFTLDMKAATENTDYLIEAVIEDLDIKHKVLKEAHEHAPKHAVFGTNTSSTLITDIAAGIPEPERVIGVHFFNPPGTMKLLEVIYGDKTSKETAEITGQMGETLGREVVYCVKDTPGFVTTRLLGAIVNECVWAAEWGEADIIEIDAAVKYRLGMPMGMFELLDLLAGGGISVQYHVGKYLTEKLGDSYRNPPMVDKMFEQGHLGKDSGRGFYVWSDGKTNEVPFKLARNVDPIRFFAPLVNEAAKLVENGFMTKEDLDKAMIMGLGYPRGPLRMADSMGLDKIVEEVNRLRATHAEERYEVSPMLAELVSEGKLGRKTKEGFYSYGPGEFELITLDVDKETKVGTLTINRPQRANALNMDCFAEIAEALHIIEADDDVRCLVLTGVGRNFSAGADISMFASGDLDEMIHFVHPLQDLLTRFETLPKVVIAAINGACLGGGLELAIACDLRVAVEGALLGFAEGNLGLFPGSGGTQRAARLIGLARAKEMIFSAQPIQADKALEWGLVNTLANKSEFGEVVQKTAQAMADKACLAQGIAKRVMYYGEQCDQRTGVFLEGSSFPPVILSEAANEGITSFYYRRKPRF
ncbi:MAG: 3-hydroxyacyl-CoA dehydrogenase NAD-binding domain-containing protein [Thermodesulfobacteriota bacterium]|nr:3-hydroxyacyl-CoA dehydrogenase NAD-binding domain-containing protein [Thermodesulfobacteriota bacterium]